MTDSEILANALKKANWHPSKLNAIGYINDDGVGFQFVEKNTVRYTVWWPTHKIIFDHGFARALWGEELYEIVGASDTRQIGTKIVLWKAFLQEMVISENPLKYLGENS